MDGKYRSNSMIIPWRQYGGANGQGLRNTILGFRFASQDTRVRGPRTPFDRSWMITLPWPFFFAIFAILPALSLRKFLKSRRTTRRQKLGLCLACGYDLHHLTSTTCPECGQTSTLDPSLVSPSLRR